MTKASVEENRSPPLSASEKAEDSTTAGSPTKSATSSGEENLVYDGGARAWMSVIGGFCVTTATFGYANAFGVYQDIYTRSGAASPSRISWIGSTQLFFLLAMGLPAGKLMDMGYFRQTTLFGSVLYVFCLFMVSIAHPDQYYQIYLAQGLGMGIGAGLLYVPAVALQSHHWRRRRALAMGIVVTGSSIGGIIFPIMLNQLFEGSTGFAWGVRASGFVVLGLLVIANLLMTENRPKSAGPAPKPDMKAILTDTPYLLSILAVFFLDWGVFFPYFYLQLFSILHGVDPNISFYTLAIMNASSMPGRIIPNGLADRYGPFNAIIPCAAACGILIFALFGVNTVAGVVVFSILYGFFSGAFLSLCAPCVASMSTNPSEVGWVSVRFGIAFALTGIGALTGTPITGALLGETFPWSKALIWSGVSCLFLFPL
ncbi:MFS general substrate transporter [Dendrothele bispora CBS 962.96]|uniref:MFS general substrate transporter n=1 Tax=Dendrothele bispora (strain CBS 962.96) TaxID=1314807 RepID=A0A4S8M9D8_DENBC|nr:MFS general substrate transporter [Dendrothele bispora CBS 962.96]